MTTPAQPATGAGAPGTGAPSTQPPANPPATPPAAPPATGQPPAVDWAKEFEGLTPAEVKAKLEHARTWEDRAKKNKAALDKATKGQAPQPEGEPTVESLQQQLAEERQGREAAETAAVEATYTSTVTRVAAQVGADVEALLDSGSFRDAVGAELEDDFDDDDLRAAIEKVAKEYAKKPRFAATAGTGPPRGGADMTGGAPPPARQRPNSLHGAIKGVYGS